MSGFNHQVETDGKGMSSKVFKVPLNASPKARSPSVYSKKVLTSTMVKPEEESFASASGNGVDNFFTESLLMEEFKTTNIRQVSGVFLVL